MKKTRGTMPEAKEMPPIAVIGDRTADAVKAIGYRVAFTPKTSDSHALGWELHPLRSPILLLRSDIASAELPQTLRIREASVVDIPVYKTKFLHRPDPKFSKLLMDNKVDCLTFASPSAVRGFFARVKGEAIRSARQIPAIALGAQTGDALQRAGFRDIRVSREATIEGIADAILGR